MGCVCGSLGCSLFPSILHTVAIVLSTAKGLATDGCLSVRGGSRICILAGLAARSRRGVAPAQGFDSLEGSFANN